MTCKSARAARFRLFPTFALLMLSGANLSPAAAPDVSFTPASLNFKYQTGAALPASQALQIKSTGAVLSFTISITGPLPYSAQWLTVSTNSGSTPATLKVYVNPTGLPSGSYSGTIVVSAPLAATTAQSLPVTLDVGEVPATLTASTASVPFTFVTGLAVPASKSVVLMSSGSAVSATVTVSGGTWLKASPTGSISLVGLPVTINLSISPTGLAPGTYPGKITISASSAATKSLVIDVPLTVNAGVPTIKANGIWPPGAVVNSPGMILTISGTNFFDKSKALVGTTELATTVLSATTLLATIPSTLMTTAGNLSVTVSTPTAASASAPAMFLVYPPGPQVWAVTNGASYNTSTVSPGAIITIFGVGLGPAGLALFPGTDPLPVSLPAIGVATSVTIDGTPSPLLYTSSTQVGCIVPYTVAAKSGSKVDLVLTYGGTASTVFKVDVVNVDPGVFTIDASGAGQGAVLNIAVNGATIDYTVNSSANAATKGSMVAIYVTGFGATTCTDVPTSLCKPAATAANLISGSVSPAAAVAVTIDGQTVTAPVSAAPIGSVPGVLQINATVPDTVKPGNAVPVVVTIGTGKSQNRVTMAVK